MPFPIPSTPRNTLRYDLLIVDDDAEILSTLEPYFSTAGLRVRTAQSIIEASITLECDRFRCLLVDQNLQDGTGLNLLQDCPGELADTIAILMTGSQDLSVAIEAVNSGRIYKFLRKPFELVIARQMVENAVAKSRELERAQSCKTLKPDTDSMALKSASEQAAAELQKAYLQSILSLTRAIEAKDRYTHGHSERVYFYCSLIAEMLELPESGRNNLRFASVLHDIGKIGIPDEILQKKVRLSEAELDIVRQHPLLSESIISPLPFLDRVRLIVRHHHEHYDGSGYPDGLRGMQIPIEARILAVADAYDAMRSDRSYRTALAPEAARARLAKAEGTQFCPLTVRAFLHALHKRGDYEDANECKTDSDWKSGAFFDVSPRPFTQIDH